jgi:hypothetical protein
MKRIIYTVAAAAAVLTGSVAAAAPAMASNGPAQFVTHINQHPDTTSLLPGYPVAGQDATVPYPNYGSVWAFDNDTVKLTPVPVQPTEANGEANYQVSIEVNGSFHGFADPTTAAPLTSDGPIKETISYFVHSPQGPNGALLPSTEAGATVQNGQVVNNVHLSDAVTQLMGPGSAIVGGGNDWVANYQNGNYVQDYRTAPSTWGDVQGH